MQEISELFSALEKAKSDKSQREKLADQLQKALEKIEKSDSLTGKEFTDLVLKIRNFAVLEDVPALWSHFKLTAAHRAAAGGDLDYFKTLDAKPMQADKWSLIPLYDAIKHDRETICDYYRETLKIRADSGYVSSLGQEEDEKEMGEMKTTLLHMLACFGDIEVLRKIKIDKAIDLMCTADAHGDGTWPIHVAIDNGQIEVLPLLFHWKMMIIADKNGDFLVHYISACSDDPEAESILNKLVALKAIPNVDQLSCRGTTALYDTFFIERGEHPYSRVVLKKRIAFAEKLLALGAAVNQKASFGKKLIPFSTGPVQVIVTKGSVDDDGKIIVESSEIATRSDCHGRQMYPSAVPTVPASSKPADETLLHYCIERLPHPPENATTEDRAKCKEEITYYLAILRFLLSKGSDLKVKNAQGLTLLQLAQFSKQKGAEHLIKSEADRLNITLEELSADQYPVENDITVHEGNPIVTAFMQRLDAASKAESSKDKTQISKPK